MAAILTKSARDSAFIFAITCPRWIFTVISLVPSSKTTCLFRIPETTSYDLALAHGQRIMAPSQFGKLASLVARGAVALEGLLNRIQ